MCPAGGWNWWVWFCCGPPVDGPPSSGRSHTAGSRRAADARSDLTGGRLKTHTRVHTHIHTHSQRREEKKREKIIIQGMQRGVSESSLMPVLERSLILCAY